MRNKPIYAAFVILIFLFVLLKFSLSSVPYPQTNYYLNEHKEDPILISGNLNLGETEEFPSKMLISNISILVNRSLMEIAPANTRFVCITSAKVNLYVEWNEDWVVDDNIINLVNPNEALCQEDSWFQQKDPTTYYSYTFPEAKNFSLAKKELELGLDNYLYYPYPFENFMSFIGGEATVEFLDTNQKVITTRVVTVPIQLENNIRAWQITVEDRAKYPTYEGMPLSWRRPTILILFYCIILFIVFATPIFVPFVRERANLISIALTYLLGIWVFRGILLPYSQIIYGLSDLFFIIGCFLMVVAILLSIYIWKDDVSGQPMFNTVAKYKHTAKFRNFSGSRKRLRKITRK